MSHRRGFILTTAGTGPGARERVTKKELELIDKRVAQQQKRLAWSRGQKD